MSDHPTVSIILEPDHFGHHLHSASWVARVASRTSRVILLTNTDVVDSDEYQAYLADLVDEGALEIRAPFHEIHPPIAEQAAVLGDVCRELQDTTPVTFAIHMDGDQALKSWWRLAPPRLRGLRPRPRITFMLTRYPSRLRINDWTSWRLRGPKAVLTVVSRLTGSLHRAVGFAGRDETNRGWLVRRAHDPAFCSQHHRDAARLRKELDLPADRTLAGIFGDIVERKNVPMLLEAIESVGAEVDIVLAGAIRDDVRGWIDSLEPAQRDRLIIRDAYLSNEDLDRYVAAMDMVPLALTNNGPSGIMGIAEAAGVPVVTAGSLVRARELEALGAGVACDLDVPSLGRAMKAVADGQVTIRTGQGDPWASAERYASILLGVDEK